MPLPKVNGWLIDFRTAQAIFHSKNNSRISHCTDLCAQQELQICHHDEDLFKNDLHCDHLSSMISCASVIQISRSWSNV